MKIKKTNSFLVGILSLTLTAGLFYSCDDASSNSSSLSLSDSKSITSFGFDAQDADGEISTSDKTVTITVPSDTDQSALTPTIEFTGESISPESDTEQDFSSSVTYTVTAEDGTTAEYVVTVSLADESEEADILDLTMQLGSDETEMNFCWFSNDTDSTNAVVQIALKSDMTGFSFPEASATEYSGSYAEVEISEDDDSDGPPARSDDTSDDDADDEDDSDEEDDDTEVYLSCEVSVDGLSADSEYVYRVGNGTVFSDMYSFSTGDTDSFSFIVVGDPQIGADDVDSDESGWTATITAATESATDCDFILGVGDQVETSTSEEQYAAFFSAEELTSLPYVNCMGNHDTGELFQYHFNSPNESDEYGVTDDAGGDYWFCYGDALFMVLNTNNTSTTTHQAFMEEAIDEAGDDITWQFVVFHHSIYSTASHAEDTDILERREYLADAFDDYDIDAVFMGHDHVYCRSYQLIDGEAQETTTETIDGTDYVVDPAGTVYLTLNSSTGSKYYDIMDDEDWTEDNSYRAVYNQDYEANYTHVEVTATTFSVNTYPSDDNTLVDSYAIYKSESDA
ncbi:MAG: metallophosphoesterase [Spirochaetales bacterium]|nr:metallophosphoesterase [Spirochaetales bacterium]